MKNITYLLAAAVITLSSCRKKPEAIFSADKTDVEKNESVQFTNTSTNAETYIWDFRDGTGSTDKDPMKLWSDAGTYSVKLTAISKNGNKSDETTISVKVSTHYLGTYSVTESWTSSYCGASTDNYTMTVVAGASAGTVKINNFANLFDNVTGNISDDQITIPPQNTVEDGQGNTWDIDGGTLSSQSANVINVSINISDIPYSNACGDRWGTGTGTK